MGKMPFLLLLVNYKSSKSIHLPLCTKNFKQPLAVTLPLDHQPDAHNLSPLRTLRIGSVRFGVSNSARTSSFLQFPTNPHQLYPLSHCGPISHFALIITSRHHHHHHHHHRRHPHHHTSARGIVEETDSRISDTNCGTTNSSVSSLVVSSFHS